MGFDKKGLACILICFLVADALGSQVLTNPNKLRGNKGLTLNQFSNLGRDAGKHITIPSNKFLVKKSNGYKSSSNCGCGSKSKSSIQHNKCERTYETIGSCETTINVVRPTQKSVDYVTKQSVCFQTVKNHSTSYNILTCTSTTKRFIDHHTAVIQVLKRICKTVQTLTTICVTISSVTCHPACVQKTCREKACVKTLKPISRNKRVLTSKSVCAKRITSTCGSIKHVKRVHERISQSIARTVICPKSSPKSNCK